MMRIPALWAAGMAWVIRLERARWPAESLERPKEGDRKKFCMSMITRADLSGDIVMGEVVVCIVTWGDEGMSVIGLEECVRSKPVAVWWRQKDVDEPMWALRRCEVEPMLVAV